MESKLSPGSTKSKSRRWIVLVLMVLPLALAATPSSAHSVSISHTPPASAKEGQDLPLVITVNGDCERGGTSGRQVSPEQEWYESMYGDTIARVGVKTQCSAMNLLLSWSRPDGSAGSHEVQMGPPDALGARTVTLAIPAADVVGSSLYYSISVSQSATGPCARVYKDRYPGVICSRPIEIRQPGVGAAPGSCTSTASAERSFWTRVEGPPVPSPSPSPTHGQGNGQGKGKK